MNSKALFGVVLIVAAALKCAQAVYRQAQNTDMLQQVEADVRGIVTEVDERVSVDHVSGGYHLITVVFYAGEPGLSPLNFEPQRLLRRAQLALCERHNFSQFSSLDYRISLTSGSKDRSEPVVMTQTDCENRHQIAGGV